MNIGLLIFLLANGWDSGWTWNFRLLHTNIYHALPTFIVSNKFVWACDFSRIRTLHAVKSSKFMLKQK